MENSYLSQRELRRYENQIRLPEIGIKGQENLKKSGIIVIGAGALGCPVLQYLTGAGIGRITIADYSLVNEGNLQKQTLYGADDIGKLKTITAKNRLEHLSLSTRFDIINLRIDESNSLRLLKNFDVIIDASNNPKTSFIINDAAVTTGIPMVYGSFYGFEGVVSVFNFKDGTTYRCYNSIYGKDESLYHDNPEMGHNGIIAGITGCLMANEVVKIITGCGEPLSNKALSFNALNNSFKILDINNNPDNPNTNCPKPGSGSLPG
jgi:sulfur-carrier protein adenylyltransferase/sulfurtransferase